MEDIGECADVSRATVFNYFPKKEDLVLAWFDYRRADSPNCSRRATIRGDTSTRLRQAFRALAHIFEDDPTTGEAGALLAEAGAPC